MKRKTIAREWPIVGRLVVAMNATRDEPCRMALNFEMPMDGTSPEWVQVLPAGQIITGRDGRTWINDRPESLLSAFAAGGKDLPIDWEHSSELRAREGKEAPAAGWIKELALAEDGSIRARVEWTARGAESVASKEYRYISPVFAFEVETLRIIQLRSCGLTNQPNLFLDALNREHHKEDHHMNLAALLAALGLTPTATFDDALNSIGKMKGDLTVALNAASNPPLDRFIPKADYDLALNRATTAETELKSIRDTQLETAINSEIDAALKAGKITPATKEYHIAQCRQEGGLERFKAFAAAAPVIAGASDLDTWETKAGTALNAEEQAVCKAMGLTEEEFLKANA